MSSEQRLNRKLPERVRREDTPGIRIDSGPFIGIIKDNVDSTRSGRLRVWIPELGGQENDPKNWRTMSYASPYSGTTYQPDTVKNNQFLQVQHSYGLWAVVPDIGNQVICTFIAGNPDRGYWFACVNPNLSHYMVPAIAAGKVDNEQSGQDVKGKYQSDSRWPVAEFNQNNTDSISPTWINNAKPPHEFQTSVLIKQGLDRDSVRGAVASSSQRESPSTVFGISTPGRPVNDPATTPGFRERMAAGTLTDADTAIRARKGGHTFVMDDGEQSGGSQLVRLRTAGGHQIMMNDSERVLYIANSDGSAWLEFTGAGHINMYSASGLNVRTEGDFNMHADGDINLNSGGTINMKSEVAIASQTKEYSIKAGSSYALQTGKAGILIDGPLNLQSAVGSWKTGGQLVLKGSKILLNTETPADVPVVADLKTFKQADTAWDSEKGIWAREESVYESIATISPSHEPWVRAAGSGVPVGSVQNMFDPAPQPAKATSVCSGPGIGAPGVRNVTPTGSTGEELVVSALQSIGKTDPTTIAAILAQCSHESGGFTVLQENLNYSASGLTKIFPKYFPTLEDAQAYSQQPERIANKVYGGRMGNGGEATGDGYKYRGRGYIQLTGKSNYSSAGSGLGLDFINNPDLASDPTNAAKIVTWFFFTLNAARTASLNWSDTASVTKIVNGGLNGLNDRQAKFDQYKQKYAGGTVTSGSGATVTDGSGQPVSSGAGKLDPGPESAKGKIVKDAAPPEVMKGADAPKPSAIASTQDKVPGLIATQMKALMLQIGYAESKLKYDYQDTALGRIGCYQFNSILLKDNGYIKPDYVSQYKGAAVFRDDAWTGKDGCNGPAAFAAAKGVQDTLLEAILNDYYAKLVSSGKGIQIQDDVCTVGGMLSVAYFLRDSERSFLSGNPPDQARFWREQGSNIKNKQDEPCDPAYNQGRYAIDILSLANETDQSSSGASNSYSPATVDINPDDVLTFTNRSGDRAHFEAATVDYKNRLLQAAKEYKAQTGKKVTISSTVRTQEEQTAIYDGWVAQGGVMPNNPTVNVPPYGNISRPVKTVGNHGLGIASDISVADAIAMGQMGILDKYGLYRFDPSGDPPHIQLKPELRPPNLQTIQKL